MRVLIHLVAAPTCVVQQQQPIWLCGVCAPAFACSLNSTSHPPTCHLTTTFVCQFFLHTTDVSTVQQSAADSSQQQPAAAPPKMVSWLSRLRQLSCRVCQPHQGVCVRHVWFKLGYKGGKPRRQQLGLCNLFKARQQQQPVFSSLVPTLPSHPAVMFR